MAEVVSSLDAVRWTVKNAGWALADERLSRGWQRALLIPPARLRWVPLGVIGIIGTWNYPLLLNAPAIAQALAAGNAVVWKPSELATSLGRKLQDSIDEAGFPDGLVSAVFGGPEVGRALIEAEVAKVLFTGGVESGRRVLATLGGRGIPALAELSGFDAAILLPGAPLESTARALTWATFVGAGQTCVAVKRAYVVGDPTPWAEALAQHARGLRVGDPALQAVDVGPMISPSARARFHTTIEAAVHSGARLLAGGRPIDGPGFFYSPTVLTADTPEPEGVLAGCFGPVVVVRGVADVESAIAAANAGPFGLSASVWGPGPPTGPVGGPPPGGRLGRDQRGRDDLRARRRPLRRPEGQRLRPDSRRRRPPGTGPAASHPRAETGRIPPSPLPVYAPSCPLSLQRTAGSSTPRGDAPP